jgi:hypothetical protein
MMKQCGCTGKLPCGCCEGVEPVTPMLVANRPGLNSLYYRIGTHATFFETMQARLSGFKLELPPFYKPDVPTAVSLSPLDELKTRSLNDPSMALLDTAATMLDVLTFYQERIANEGYLKTATERRSILELGRLVGYKMRPGVAASVYLAYTLDDKSDPVEIPEGALSKSVPGQNELPQSFETSDKLEARKEWNNLKPRWKRPQKIIASNATFIDTIYLEGTETKLKPNDPLLFVFEGRSVKPVLRKIKTVEPLFDDNKTRVTLQFSRDRKAIEKAVAEIIDKYLDNFREFCLDTQDELVSRTLNLLLEISREPPDDESTRPDPKQVLKDAITLAADIYHSGNAPVQKWVISLLNELLQVFLASGVFDELLENLQEITDFENAAENSDLLNELPDLLKFLRVLDGFDELMAKIAEALRKLGIIKALLIFLQGISNFDRLIEALRIAPNLTQWAEVLRTLDVFDEIKKEVLSILRRVDLLELFRTERSFNALIDTLLRVPNFTRLIRILRTEKDFQKTVEDMTSLSRGMDGFDQSKFDQLIGTENERPIEGAFADLLALTAPLSAPPSIQPANSVDLERDITKVFSLDKDTMPKILTSFNPGISTVAYEAWGKATVEPDTPAERPAKVYALRATASLFGSNAPPRILDIGPTGVIKKTGEYPIVEEPPSQVRIVTLSPAEGNTGKKNDPANTDSNDTETDGRIEHEEERSIYLDSINDKVTPNTWIVVDMSEVDETKLKQFALESEPGSGVLISRVTDVAPSVSRTDYGISGKATLLKLANRWIRFITTDEESGAKGLAKPSEAESQTTGTGGGQNDALQEVWNNEFKLIRRTVVHTQSEELPLAEEPVRCEVCGDTIELGELYNGLEPGRWLIVSGERTDIPDTSGIMGSELVMLKDIQQGYNKNLPGDKTHSSLIFANKLAYTYKRDTVVIYGNVVKATHGETRSEVLGSGDATRALQAFTLKQPPLTYVSAPTTEGIESTLHVRVNDIEWHLVDTLAGLQPQDRKFVTKTDDDDKTTVIFGNGEQGARAPTGVENVKAVYRNGIGKGGNVKAGQISLLMTKPLGVREVINPLRASGGADKETRDQARRNVPVALKALDRLVSTVDYADFARTYAGIGKASARRLFDGHRQVVYLTIAGVDDIPIDKNLDLYRNLRKALLKFGDPYQALQIEARELIALVISAKVQVQPDYMWEAVEPKIRAALVDTFSFDRRELGQSVFLSQIISAIQAVAGVAYVDVDVLDGISETELNSGKLLDAKVGKIKAPGGATKRPNQFVQAELARDNPRPPADGSLPLLSAQLAFLLPDVPNTLILNEISEVKK